MIRQNTHQSDFQMPDVRCADEDLAMHVPQDICIKIWKHEYINLAALLKKIRKGEVMRLVPCTLVSMARFKHGQKY